MHHTCWLSSSTTSMAPPRMFSTTFDACTVSSLLVCRSEDEGRRTKYGAYEKDDTRVD
jgi:hypothetical protein